MTATVAENETRTLEPIPDGKEGNSRFRLWGDAQLSVLYNDETENQRQIDGGAHRFSSMSGTIVVRVRNGKADVSRR